MSLVLKIVIPVVIIGGLVWLYMAKYPSLLQQSAPAPVPEARVPQETAEQKAARDTSDVQLQADLKALDGDIQTATDANASAQTFNDEPVAQTE